MLSSWRLLAACLLVLLGVSSAVACGGAGSGSTSQTAVRSQNGEPIEITLIDTDFEPATIMVSAGEEVTLTLVNDGSVKHNFSIPDLKVSQDVASGQTQTVTFTAPSSPGEHEIICDVPGHKSAGMVGTLVVEE